MSSSSALSRSQLLTITDDSEIIRKFEKLFAAVVPTGTILAFGGQTAPDGFLFCDGSAVNRTQFSELFSWIGTAWGSGDGSRTFNLPDLRGKFTRGYDSGAGNDPDASSRAAQTTGGNTGDNVGSVQADAFQGWQLGSYADNSGVRDYYSIVSVRDRSHDVHTSADYGRMDSATGLQGISQMLTAQNDGTHGDPRKSSETRPINANVMYIIKT